VLARESRCAEVQRETGATLIHPYLDPQVIAGQATATMELLTDDAAFDALVVPVGGGGLASGAALAVAALAPRCRLFVAEPSGAAETAASLARGMRVTDFVPDTICDGLRGTLGALNFELLQAHGVEALVVDDVETVRAMRLVWSRMKQLIEPSSATALAAVLRYPKRFAGQRVGIVLSGGNVDLDALPALFASA